MKRIRKSISLLACLALLAGGTCFPARAEGRPAPGDEVMTRTGLAPIGAENSQAAPAAEGRSWNDRQFETYVDRLFSVPGGADLSAGTGRSAGIEGGAAGADPTSEADEEAQARKETPASYFSSVSVPPSLIARGQKLTGADKAAYDAIYLAIQDIASGRRESTVIDFSTGSYDSSDLSLENVDYALLADCPYLLYWFDKTVGVSAPVSSNSNTGTIRFAVAAAYSKTGRTGTYDIDTRKTSAPEKAAARARRVASLAYNMDLYQALDFYRAWIISHVDYNHAAADNDEQYGDPWQMVYVFDNDPSTKVVCEGYSKAFKFLCDCWKDQHPSSPMDCYLVSGWMRGNVSGPHMWNIVRMDDGKNYVCDITNSDNDIDGGRQIFLKGAVRTGTATMGNVERTASYQVSLSDRGITYSYLTPGRSQSESLSAYTEDEIRPAGSDYSPHSANMGRFQDVDFDRAYYGPAVTWAVSSGITSGTTAVTFSPDQAVTRGQIIFWLYKEAGSPAVSGYDSFVDVKEDAFYRDAVIWAGEEGITSGTGNGRFSPDEPCTRCQIVTFLYQYAGGEASGGNSFLDVYPGDYYDDAVTWAQENDLSSGVSQTRFDPFGTCTRGMAVAMLYKLQEE